MPAFTFYDCCPECGRDKSYIHSITGRWVWKKICRGVWPLRTTTEVRDRFIEITGKEE